ncbi:MAG: type II toxin-antitoxin system Phd/YefM family antitoxin [Gammaproteobacteria bacterium]|nr:type II toxin-antitoxin system Phd/YefM family antitoxin [Gammaproteobacteria bacterium]
MRETTFTELRNHAKRYFDLVEAGETVRVLRHGRPVAEIQPIVEPVAEIPSWKRRRADPLLIPGVEAGRLILQDRGL